ncbi:MAG: hypothetical protein J0M11_20805 [Anaerolineae bacterium]|nr:hypothetical protein [Anaerolineae bacterium]
MNNKKSKNKKEVKTSKHSLKESFNTFKDKLKLIRNLDSTPDIDTDIKLFNQLSIFKKTEKKEFEALFRKRLGIYYARTKFYIFLIYLIYFAFYFLIFNSSLLYSIIKFRGGAIPNNYSGLFLELPLSIELLLLTPIIYLFLILYAALFKNVKSPNKLDIWGVLSITLNAYEHIAIISILLTISIQYYSTIVISAETFLFFTSILLLIIVFLYVILYFSLNKFINFTGHLFANSSSKYVFINEYQDTDLIIYFYLLLSFIQKHKQSILSSIIYKKSVIEYLDNIAIEFLNFTNRTFSSKEPQFKDWVTKNTEEIISYINSRKAIIFNANEKSLSEFEKYCKDSFIHLLKGEWGKLERLEHTLPKKRDWKAYILESSKLLIVGLVPVLTVYLMDKYQVIEITTVNYLYFATIIWAIINLMLAIEPGILDRIKLAKDMTDIIKK